MQLHFNQKSNHIRIAFKTLKLKHILGKTVLSKGSYANHNTAYLRILKTKDQNSFENIYSNLVIT